MKSFSVLLGCLAASSLIMPVNAQARETEAKHTLGSGPDVYRIEVRNLKRFEVMETGDRDGVGELHELTVRLQAREHRNSNENQYHSKTENATPGFLYNAGTGDGGNLSYLNVRKGNHVLLHGRANHDNLWIHARAVTDWGSRTPIELRVSARELDCAGKRVCRRGGVGSFTISFNIPNFVTPPSNSCGVENTFKLLPVDGKLTITGVDNVEDHTYQRGDTRVMNVLTQHKTGGVVLRPFNADICIASTSRSGTTTLPANTQTPTSPDMNYIQNRGSDRCLSMPNTVITGREAPAFVTSCRKQTSTDSPTKQKWILESAGAHDVFFIKSTMSNHCLNLKSSVDNREGGPVKLVGCSDHNDQKWRRTHREGSGTQFQNVSSGKCLIVRYPEHKDWGKTAVYSCSTNPNQMWWSTKDSTAAEIARWPQSK